MNLLCLGELAITIVSNQTTFYELCRPRPRAEVNQSLHQLFLSWEWAVPNRQLQFLKYHYNKQIFVWCVNICFEKLQWRSGYIKQNDAIWESALGGSVRSYDNHVSHRMTSLCHSFTSLHRKSQTNESKRRA